MNTFELEYRKLERLQGVSLHDQILLYKVRPEIVTPHEESPFLRILPADEPKLSLWAAAWARVARLIK